MTAERRARGFTLLEMLLATAITALLVTIAVQIVLGLKRQVEPHHPQNSHSCRKKSPRDSHTGPGRRGWQGFAPPPSLIRTIFCWRRSRPRAFR